MRFINIQSLFHEALTKDLCRELRDFYRNYYIYFEFRRPVTLCNETLLFSDYPLGIFIDPIFTRSSTILSVLSIKNLRSTRDYNTITTF